MTAYVASLEDAVSRIRAHVDGALHVGAPLGIGKPHRLLNALYDAAVADAARPMTLYTALSLDPPTGGHDLEGRFIGPFAARHFGEDFVRLKYVDAMRRDALPAHIAVEEFYMQSGAMLGSRQAQRRYASLNYTHVARALADRGVNVLVQKVAANEDGTRFSLSSNTDLTFDTIDALAAAGHARPLVIGEVDPELPWLGGAAAVDAAFFDVLVVPPPPYPKLFGLPRQPVSDADYAIGFYASALVRDGGTLQIGIGALADAMCHALALRHTDNAAYRRVLHALDPGIATHPAVVASGGLDPFAIGLYGCSEMINEGFKRLVEVGVIRRKVVDKAALMRRANAGTTSALDDELIERDGEFLHGAFYLGSPDFYAWLRDLDPDTRRGIGMKRVGEVNELFGLDEGLERLQRRDARFFNSCMMATALGAAVSDGLDDGRVVSGVGGQYNFVAMGHALPDARFVGDSTQTVYSGNHLVELDGARRWFNASTGYGTLGYGLPAAIGAKLAEPQRPVISLMGDGGIQFTLPELASAVEARVGIIVLLWNNAGYGEIKRYMQRRDIEPIGVDIYTPDLLAIARGFGCAAERARDHAHLAELLRDAPEDRPLIIEVQEAAPFHP